MKSSLLLISLLSCAASFAVASPEIGKGAPDFSLTDTAGKSHSLSDYKGKVVVLEWVNFGCPFVRKHYDSKNMQKLQAEAKDKGVVWLSICSSAPGKQGNMRPDEAAAAVKKEGSNAAAYLIDETGDAGKAYDARTTPELFIINAGGTLVYMGAIDDKKSTNLADIDTAKNYVRAALDDVLAGRPVAMAKTTSYGCSVKYP